MKNIPPMTPPGLRKISIPGKPLNKAADGLKNTAQKLQGLVENSPLDDLIGLKKKDSDLARLLERAAGSEISRMPGFGAVRKHIENELEHDGGAAMMETLKRKAAEARGRSQPAISFAQDLARRLQPAIRVKREVLMPLRLGTINGATAVSRLDKISGMSVRGELSRRVPGWTIGIGGTLEGGFVGSVGGALGICFDREITSFLYGEFGVGIGVIAEVEFALHIQVAPCSPIDFGGLSFNMAAGGAYGVSGTLEVGLAPSIAPDRNPHDPLVLWEFDGVTLQVGAGVGVEVSCSFSGCRVFKRI
ncbi:MAG: hypothetical protein KF855_10220 [Acidobacteria bacterium]|nr:hypothetical protein [Acidobacteriota bacterium]